MRTRAPAKVGRRRSWSRLASITSDELKTRARQELQKRWDTICTRLGISLVPAAVVPGYSEEPRFFFAASEVPVLVDLLQKRLPDVAQRILVEAESICSHKFSLLGYERVDYGPKIDWHLDAVHGKRSPRRPWYAIDPFDFDQVGDPKITWELNRHQHLVTLAKAQCLDGEDRFSREAIEQWQDWQRENPYPTGLNWASGLEVAIRSLSWIWTWRLLAACDVLPSKFESELRRALALNGRHIELYLSTYSSPNTHLIGEAAALLFIGVLLPEVSAATRWRNTGWQILLREADRQVRSDGLYFEQSIHYHVYALDFLLHSKLLAGINRIASSAALDSTLERMLDILATLSYAGPPPRFGDDDGGRVFDPRRNRAEHMTDPLAAGAVLFGRPDFKAAASGLREEMLWSLGAEGVRRFDALPAADCLEASRAFEPSKVIVMTSSKPPRRLAINCGAPGTASGGHGHADLLSVELALDGNAWLIDPGALCFASSSDERDRFRGTAAHNTLQVDRLSQADPAGPFAWHGLPAAAIERWVAGKSFDLLIASHQGYCRLPNPVVHRRWIFHLKSAFWLIRDLAQGNGVHQLDVFWHLAPECVPRRSPSPGVWSFAKPGDPLTLLLLTACDSELVEEVARGTFSPAYGRRDEAPVLHFGTRTKLPAELATLLVPTTQALEDVRMLSPLRDERESGMVTAYRYGSPGDCHFMFLSDSSLPWKVGKWTSDAQFLYLRLPADHEGVDVLLCNGSYVGFQDLRLIDCHQSVVHYEWMAGSRQAVSTDGPSGVNAPSAEALAHIRENVDSVSFERN